MIGLTVSFGCLRYLEVEVGTRYRSETGRVASRPRNLETARCAGVCFGQMQKSFRESRCIAALWLVVAALPLNPAMGHTLLDPQKVAQLLARIARSRAESALGKTRTERLDALYNIGAASVELANLINVDFQAHGSSDPELMDLIFRRLQQYGVTINKTNDGYRYDLAAFREYLRLAPSGLHAAGSHFALLKYGEAPEHTAFAGFDEVEKAISWKTDFIRNYPRHPGVSYVQLQLARDHLRIIHLLRSESGLGDEEKETQAVQHQNAACRLLKEITARHPDSPEAKDARNVLASLGR